MSVIALTAKKLDVKIGDLVEIEGRKYDVVSDKQGGVALEPAITITVAEMLAEEGLTPLSEEEFEEQFGICPPTARASRWRHHAAPAACRCASIHRRGSKRSSATESTRRRAWRLSVNVAASSETVSTSLASSAVQGKERTHEP